MQEEVSSWVEKIVIPTYGIGRPEKNPIFLEKRVYQGSKGAVYPHPVIEKILDEKTDREYTAVFLENRYLKIMVLPELGGRIQRAYDKVRQRDFIYYNQVIKPALVGLTGPWISGGIEFNWPQHHRPSTFDPIDFTIEQHKDGSKTIWVNEVEIMTRTKGMAGFTLYPGQAFLEVRARLFNRSALPQTFLWWANPAVKVNDCYQSVFPPDVYAVFDHGKRDVSEFPVARGIYYKTDYSPGTDISRYKNIPVPTSYMAIRSKYDFIGCYEHDTEAGMLHVADHHISPGKKQWTWGNGDFGVAWDRNLTDEDGPYIELMCGAFTDNQPDFSWLQPNEEKTFEQYFMPYAGIGVVKNATKQAAVNLEIDNGALVIKVYATAAYPASVIRLRSGTITIWQTSFDLSPENIYKGQITVDRDTNLRSLVLEVIDCNQQLLVHYAHTEPVKNELPQAATAAKPPAEIESNELLFLNGLHLEQYRHATFNPTDYYLEALRRDEGDSRCNNAMGLWLLRRGQAAKAEKYFRSAIARITQRNPNPYDGEVYYNLGLSLNMLDRHEEAFDCFYKATWNDAWQHSGFFQLARIAALKVDFDKALYLVEKSLVKNYSSHSARHLKVVILRKEGKLMEALEWIESSLEIDKFNFGCRFEHYLVLQLTGEQGAAAEALTEMKHIMRDSFSNYVEYALDYVHAGLYAEAFDLLMIFREDSKQKDINPLVGYYLGYIQMKLNRSDMANTYFREAASANPDFCFPSRVEEVSVLTTAITHNPSDAKAHYYLGNYWYANGQYTEAIECWERSVELDQNFPTVHRNLSLAYYNKRQNKARAVAFLRTAFALDNTDGRILMELDQLYKILNYSHWERLQMLEDHLSLVEGRDDLYLERIVLYNLLGDFETAFALIGERKFHPWEGGEGKTVAQYLLCQTELAKKAIKADDYTTALDLLAPEYYPHNLGEGKLPGAQENDIHFLQGCAYQKAGMGDKATERFEKATHGISEPVQAIFYNDPQPDKILYQGLAWMKLGNTQKAADIFHRLIEFGNQHMNDDIRIDYFAVSLPDLQVFDQDLNLKNRIHCHYLVGLGHLGLGNYQQAADYFNKLLEWDSNHQGAIVHNNMIDFLSQESAEK